MAHARPPRRSSVGVPLDQLTEFWQVWDCLRDCGWTQVRVGGDPRFVRPGCASGYGQEGFEWFGDSEDVQDHVRDHCIDGRERTGALEWWELWDALRDQGWKRHRSGKLLAPGGSIEGTEGRHWFAAPDDVVSFRKRPPTKTKDVSEAWRALEALGWREDARGPHGRKEARYLKPGGVSARRGGIEGQDFFRSREDAVEYAAKHVQEDDDELRVAPASPQIPLTQESPDDPESPRRMSCPIEALGLGDTPRWPVFRNSPIPFDENYGEDGPQQRRLPRREPPVPEEDDDWASLWKDLKRVGWSRAAPSGLETERFLRPGAEHCKSLERGRHFFTSRTEVRDFVRSRRVDCEDLTGHVDEDGPSSSDDDVPQAVESPESSDSPVQQRDTPLWRRAPSEIWKTLRDHGWTYKTGDLEYPWHYLRPGARRKGGILGIDYFGSEEQVREFVERKKIDLVTTFGHVDEDAQQPVPEQKATRRQQALVSQASSPDQDGFAPSWKGPWAQNWNQLRELGWEWRYGPAGATRWVRPGGIDDESKNIRKDARSGAEFFESEDSVLRFCREWQVGWQGRTGHISEQMLMGRARAPRKSQGSAQKGRRRKAPERLADKVQEKKKPKKIEKAKARAAAKRGAVTAVVKRRDSHDGVSPSLKPLYKLPLQAMWQRLRADHGWRDARGDNLRPWFYVRPGVSEKRSEWREGRDYFATQEDLRAWCVDHRIDGVERSGALAEKLESSKPKLVDLRGADLWQRLREIGWIKRASTDASKPPWRFFRPGADVLEVPPTRDHFFCTLEDVSDFVILRAIDGVDRKGHVDEVYEEAKPRKRGRKKSPPPPPPPPADDDDDDGGGDAPSAGGPRGRGGGPRGGGGGSRPRRGGGGGSDKPPPRKRGRGGGGPRAGSDGDGDAPDRGGCAVAAAAPRRFGRELTNGSAGGAPPSTPMSDDDDDDALRVAPPSPSAPLLTQAAAAVPMSDDDDDALRVEPPSPSAPLLTQEAAEPLSRSSSDASQGRRRRSGPVSYAEPSLKARLRRSSAGSVCEMAPRPTRRSGAAAAPSWSDDDDDDAPPAAAASDDDAAAPAAMSDDDAAPASPAAEEAPAPKKKRGRPRKSPAAEEDAAPALPAAEEATSDEDAAAPAAMSDDDAPAPVALAPPMPPVAPPMPPAALPPSPETPRRPCPAWDERGWDALLATPPPERWRGDSSLAPFVEAPAVPETEPKKTASPSKRRGATDTEEADSSIAARVFDAAYHRMGNNFGALYSRLLKPRGWTYATTANRTGGLYTAPGAKTLTEKIEGTHTFESADEVLKFVREDPSMAKELRRISGDDSLSGGSVFKPSTISLWRSSTTPQTTKGFVSTFFTTKSKEKRGGKRKGYDGHGRRPGKRSRRLDARDARLRGEEERRKAERQAASELVLPSVAEALKYKDSTTLKLSQHFVKDQRRQFGSWLCKLLGGGVSLMLQGFGSKYDLLEAFTDEVLSEEGEVVVIKGYDDADLRLELIRAASSLKLRLAPLPNEERGSTVAIAKRFAAACAKAQRDVFIVVHSVDAKRLRSQDCQAALAALNASHSYLVASADHVNAPLLWNATTWRAANFCSEDATTFAPYDREAGRWDPFERTSNAKSQQKLLDTSGLVYVLQSLTPRHVELLRLLATAQQESNEGMLFKTLQSQCRYKMIAHTEDQVHSYLVELTDHGLCRKEVRSGSTYVAVEPGYVEAILAAT